MLDGLALVFWGLGLTGFLRLLMGSIPGNVWTKDPTTLDMYVTH